MTTKFINLLAAITLFLCANPISAQDNMRADTYCNPLNIDYTYMVYNSDKDLSYRSGADPAVVEFRGEYYMFVTRSMGYWHSTDLLNWNFITPEKWYFQGSNAPAAHNYRDSVLYVTGDPSGNMSILFTDNPKKGDWKAVPAILNNLQDPDLFIDDDGRTYMYWGSSNVYPLKGYELDRNHRFLPMHEPQPLFNLNEKAHGWERFGENHTHPTLSGYMEGAWLTKHNGTYYMQYAAPGTEFNVYGDGVYTSTSPMGPYKYQAHNPISYKPGGFMNGAGHGSTVVGPGNKYWHFGSMSLSVNVNWERRLCMYPLFFDKDGVMYTNTRFGDYPHYAPAVAGKDGDFRGWMLLSYNKPVKTSSSAEGHDAINLTDENVKKFWLASGNDSSQWAEIDLINISTVNAIQINYFDYKNNLYGRIEGLAHRYMIEASIDGKNWNTIINKSNSFKDTPNDYTELAIPLKARYIRYKHISAPGVNLAISDIRIFGVGNGKIPSRTTNFKIERHEDRRDATITWKKDEKAQGYNIFWGIEPDKLYNSWMVYGDDSLLLKALNTDNVYYFAIESFNENGVSQLSKVIKVD